MHTAKTLPPSKGNVSQFHQLTRAEDQPEGTRGKHFITSPVKLPLNSDIYHFPKTKLLSFSSFRNGTTISQVCVLIPAQMQTATLQSDYAEE